jgi:hypothetical protein
MIPPDEADTHRYKLNDNYHLPQARPRVARGKTAPRKIVNHLSERDHADAMALQPAELLRQRLGPDRRQVRCHRTETMGQENGDLRRALFRR